MGISFFIPSNRFHNGRPTHVDGWNEYIKAVNVSRYVGNAREQENVAHVEQWARVEMARQRFTPPKSRARVRVAFFEINNRRDVSNVLGGLKWVLDGLSRPRGSKRKGAGLIVDDSSRWVEVEACVRVRPESPGVFVSCEFANEEGVWE